MSMTLTPIQADNRSSMQDVLLLAAEIMEFESQFGCCWSIGYAAQQLDLRGMDYQTIEAFKELFAPRAKDDYWFGSGRPQIGIYNLKTERRVRHHRVFALLLAAEVLK
jgi:hypothetical protein